MIRQITLGFAVVSASFLTATIPASAQGFPIKMPKPPKVKIHGVELPRMDQIPQPGPYQRGMIERSFEYGVAGASAGGSVGTMVAPGPGSAVGAAAGGAVGVTAGAIAYDRQHTREREERVWRMNDLDVNVVNQWWRPVTFEIWTGQGWMPFQLPPNGSRGFKGPAHLRFQNAQGQWRAVTMQGRAYVFRGVGPAVELFW